MCNPIGLPSGRRVLRRIPEVPACACNGCCVSMIRRLTVLNVGDGASAVATLPGGEGMVLDCGSWRSDGSLPAQVLASALGRGLSQVSTLVVSHFDADHWKGLQALPSVVPRSHLPRQVAIRYPGLSSTGRATIAAAIALRTIGEGVSLRAQDLIAAWTPVAAVDAQPLFAGDHLMFGTDRFDVVWPPRILPQAWSRAASRTLKELQDLADQMPAPRDALDEAYEGAWSGAVADDATGPGGDDAASEGYLAGLTADQRADLEQEVESDLAQSGVQTDGVPRANTPTAGAAPRAIFGRRRGGAWALQRGVRRSGRRSRVKRPYRRVRAELGSVGASIRTPGPRPEAGGSEQPPEPCARTSRVRICRIRGRSGLVLAQGFHGTAEDRTLHQDRPRAAPRHRDRALHVPYRENVRAAVWEFACGPVPPTPGQSRLPEVPLHRGGRSLLDMVVTG